MQQTLQLEPRGYYIIESLACGRNCYFESEQEIERFQRLWNRYLKGYVEIHKMYFSSEAYQIVMRIKSKEVLIKRYMAKLRKGNKILRQEFVKEPWRIISEQIRIFLSVYVKEVNRLRGRKGALVQNRYKKYHFESAEEHSNYIEEMENRKKEIKGQSNERYQVSKKWKKHVDWDKIRGVFWVERFMCRAFRNYVVDKLINFTLQAHISPP